MLMSKVLFKKMTRIFDGMFDDVIEDRAREGEEYNIQVIDVEEDRYLLLICFYEFDETFFVFYDIEDEQAYIVGFEEDEETKLMMSSNIGSKILPLLETMLNESLDYFDENYDFGCGFENVEVFDYDIKELEDKCKQDLGDNNSIEISKRTIVVKDTHKLVSVDAGMGQLIKKLSEQKIITMFSCVDSYISLYCFEAQLEFVKTCVESYFKDVKVETDKECWVPSDDGRKMYTFRW